MSIAPTRTKMIRVLLSLGLLTLACKDEGTTPPPIPERVRLTLIDVAVREAYFHIAVSSPASNETLFLQRLPAGQAGNGATVMTFAAVADTNIADTALAQNTSYAYTVTLQANGKLTSTSNTISAQTLLPTSHNFTWQTYLLGDGNSSALYDVAIINDTLIYAVGELYLRDSTGTIDETPYNLAKWDGARWQLLRIQFYTFCGQTGTGSYPARAVFAFSPQDIWIAMAGSQVVRWNGQTQSAPICTPVSINKLWGESPGSVYAVGNGGGIAHHNGTVWQRVESGTTTQINDAWGVLNPATGAVEVYCPVTSFFTPGDKRVLKITDNGKLDSMRWEPWRNIYSAWTHNGIPLYAAGSTVHRRIAGLWRETQYGSSLSVNRIRGNSLNDVFLAGDFGLLVHYDGLEWRQVGYDYDVVYGSIAVRGDIVVAAGQKNARGIVTIGRRH